MRIPLMGAGELVVETERMRNGCWRCVLVKGESRKKVRLGPGHFGLRYLFCLEGATGTAALKWRVEVQHCSQSRRYVSHRNTAAWGASVHWLAVARQRQC
ncbi:hypothetical protein HZ326_3800 [Fusarium oxysporum f. sp. albedinis]|nr:hypothetical protein HZ326_3800 [Fusarium oxysporum f. sp. albedinis]